MKIQILSYRLPTATPDPTRHSSCGWIALIDDTEVGWCNMSFLPNKVIKLEDAFIKFDYRGKGIYKKLWWTRWEYLNEHFKDHKIILIQFLKFYLQHLIPFPHKTLILL